MTVRPLQT